MNRHFVALAVVVVTPSWIYAQTPVTAEEATIRQQLDRYAEARRVGDGEAQALFYSEDADEYGDGAKRMAKGRKEIAQWLSVRPDPDRKFRLEIVNISLITPDVALVDTRYYNQVPPESYPGHAFYVMIKRGDQWLIRSARIGFPPKRLPAPQQR